jgi:hypothetical protein
VDVVSVVSMGLDRDRFSLTVLGGGYDSPCPVCGIVAGEPQACVLLDEAGRLLRGDLQREARAATSHVVGVLASLGQGDAGVSKQWLDTRLSGHAPGGEGGWRCHVVRARRQKECLGPHGPALSVDWGAALGAGGDEA